jgi:hypothetical protein
LIGATFVAGESGATPVALKLDPWLPAESMVSIVLEYSAGLPATMSP